HLHVLIHDEVPHALGLPCGRPPAEAVGALLLHALVGHLDVAKHFGAGAGDDACVDVGAGPKIVEDTGGDGGFNEVKGVLSLVDDEGKFRLYLDVTNLHVFRPATLKHGHRSERATSHGHVRQLVGGAMWVDGEEMGACRVDATKDEGGTDVPLVAEEHLLEHGHCCDDSGCATGGE
ncbi:hypothetical protein H0H87_007703, partial [Tephrocybe sp. NHM501043]